MERSIPRSCAALVLAGILLPAEVRAQTGDDDRWEAPAWVGDVTFLGANVLLGAVTAGILREIRGGSFQEGFARGAFGGGLSYGGRRLAAREFWGAGLLGRQVSALGAAVVRNASEGRPVFSRLLFAAGPLMLNVDRDSASGIHVRVDARSTVWLVSAVLDDRLDLDWNASLSAGAPVFEAPRHRFSDKAGQVKGGVILLGSGATALPRHRVLAHERVHVLQHDFGRAVWGGPLETWLASFIPGGSAVVRYVEPGLAYPWMQALLVNVFDLEWGNRPWEIEAEFLEHR